MSIIDVQLSSLTDTESELSSKAEQLIGILEQLTNAVNSAEWEGDDQSAHLELQEMCRNEDTGLIDCLNEIAGHVGVSAEGYQNTVLGNAGRFNKA